MSFLLDQWPLNGKKLHFLQDIFTMMLYFYYFKFAKCKHYGAIVSTRDKICSVELTCSDTRYAGLPP